MIFRESAPCRGLPHQPHQLPPSRDRRHVGVHVHVVVVIVVVVVIIVVIVVIVVVVIVAVISFFIKS